MFDIHQFDIRFLQIIRWLQQINKNEHAKKHVYNFFHFFINYVIIQISIFDWKLTLCLNIDENVFLYNRNFVFRDRDVYNFVKRIKFIIVIEISLLFKLSSKNIFVFTNSSNLIILFFTFRIDIKKNQFLNNCVKQLLNEKLLIIYNQKIVEIHTNVNDIFVVF